ncbi:hypothetical protein RRG08_025776 [Elysia crispata]|uniref:Uncharacterized protein n=1 Tax=Elysia crispata TaxID=231223 RepID=A0AAE1DZ01_9GAST|nr:hypothetical protein RRG08_025776 [Elysia crispata]
MSLANTIKARHVLPTWEAREALQGFSHCKNSPGSSLQNLAGLPLTSSFSSSLKPAQATHTSLCGPHLSESEPVCATTPDLKPGISFFYPQELSADKLKKEPSSLIDKRNKSTSEV